MAKKKTATRKTTRGGTKAKRRATAKQASKSTPSIPSESDEPRFPVVGIGASAGGLDAFKKFFAAMPAGSGMAFVLIPHLDPTHESLMVELLTRQTAMPVVEAEDGTEVRPNCVYIIPPNKYLAIADGVLQLSVPPTPRGLQTAIDFFLRSLAADQGERAIGIVLSGTGSHGTPGIREIKLAGGMVMAQEAESAEYDQMPRSAIASGVVDYVLPPERMPAALVKYVEQPYLNRVGAATSPPEEAAEQLNRVLAVLRTRTKYDFRSYRKNMLMRRVLRRMGLRHIDQFAAYLNLLRESTDEVTALYKDLLIGVTAFFREAEAFNVLEQQVIPELVERADDEEPIRVWVPACATGEEAYSIAMLLMEGFAAADKPFNLQIFASDIDDQSLDVARTGIYPASIVGDVSPERLKRFFIKVDENHYQVNKQLRESIVFAAQNLISDAPFSRLDLISCRNLLIYLEPDVQQKVIALFHFALGDDGYLLLGPSESIGRAVDLFEPMSKKWRVYRRIGPVRRELVEIPIVATPERRGMLSRAEPTPVPSKGFRELTEKLILSDYAPAAALINRKYEILYVTGPLVNYLEFPTGELTKDLLAMTRQGLRTKVRAACHQAIRESWTVIDAEARVRRGGSYVPCTITVRPITEPKEAEGLMLVTFQDRDSVGRTSIPSSGTKDGLEIRPTEDAESKLVQQLELELKSTREDLQSTIEEMESSNEELKASNEEVMSMNEELQSANEELETSKEELQSLNEELSTVNHQLEDKVAELDEANNDMTNLMASSDISTVFLDTELRIVRFTPPTARLLNLMATDVGRPFRDFAPRFTNDGLLDECQTVLDKLAPVERELHTDDKRFFLRRILPYRTSDNRIAGVAVTYFDITARVKAEAEMRRLATVTRDSNDAVTVQSLDGRILVWNRGAERMYGYSRAEALKMNVRELVPEDLRDEALAALHRAAESKESESFDTKRVTKVGRTLNVWLTLSKLTDEAGEAIAVATTERDVTGRTHETRLLAEAISHLGEGVIITSDGLDWPGPRIVFVNEAICQITGYTKNELIGQTPRILQGDGSDREIRERIKAELSAGRSCVAELVNHRKDGTPYNAELFITPLFDADGHRTNFVAIHRDISERKQAEKELRDSETQKSAILRSLTAHIAVIDRDGTIVSVNPAWEQFARDNEGSALRCNVGANYLEVCRKAEGECADEAPRVAAGLQAILAGNAEEFSLEYACHSTTEQRWFFVQATSFQSEEVGAVVSHTNITERKRAEEELRQQHELSDGIINSAQHIILLLDTEGRIVRFNPFLESLSGWRLDEVQGRSWFDTFLPEHNREQIRRRFSRAIGGGRTQGNVNSIVTEDGRELEIEWHDTTLTSVAGELLGLLCTGQDITERKRAEQALDDREERLRSILNTAADAIINIDQRGIITDVNPATETMFGYTQAELVGQNVKILMPQPYHDEHDGYLARYLKTGEARIIGIGREVVGRHKDGSTFPAGLAVSQVDHLGIFTGVVRDISTVKELQKQVLEIAAEEDRRIGHELHDNIQQQLTGLGLLARTVADRLEAVAATISNLAETADMAARVADGINEAAKHVHLLSRGLVPVEVDAEGLRSTLTDFSAQIGEQYRVECEFKCEGEVGVADNFVATHLYRIVQEAVNNAIKHGRAKHIEISLTGNSETLTLEVLDNGIGIGDKRGDGMGLRIMQYRAGLIGAMVRVTPAQPKGTFVSCTLLRGGGVVYDE